MNRQKNIDRIRSRTKPWDIVIIGGGATGVGCALDAATRGLDVLLVEQNDFGSGTSSKSTKLVHGGVRYLKQGNISLVREALRERGLLLANAPHVVHKQEFIVPCRTLFEKLIYGIGLKLYDVLAGKLSLGKSRFLSRSETLDRLPGIDPNKVAGGISYWDGQFDDTRLLIDMVVTADKNGACLVNYVRLGDIQKSPGDLWELSLWELIDAENIKILARSVINATGAYCDPIRRMSDETAKPVVTFARGSHIVLSREFLPSEAALMIPETSDGRVLFCIPWLGHTLVGTTDVPCKNTEHGAHPSDEEIDFLLETAGQYLAKQPTRDDILSKFAGVRPLVSRANATNTSKLSRSHELFVDKNGLITITGGKWTTYRQMAEQAVDAGINIAKLDAAECNTKTLAIDPPPPSTGELLHPELPYRISDIERAIMDEMSVKPEDVLERRTRALFLNSSAARELGNRVTELIGQINDRNASQISGDKISFEITSRKFVEER